MADQEQQNQPPQDQPPQDQQEQQAEVILLPFDKKHNICAYVDPDVPDLETFGDMLTFLRRSKITYDITARPKVYLSIIRQFWNTAAYVEDDKIIRATINRIPITIDVAVIRRVLQFDDTDDYPSEFDRSLVRGLFTRLHYNGDILKSMLNKNGVSAPYKYLLHVLLHCMSGRRGGFDECRLSLQSAFVALILNKLYKYSELVFDHLKKQVQQTLQTKKFLMYPLIDQLGVDNILHQEHMTADTVHRMLTYRKEKPKDKRIIGHIINPNYECPPNERWIHDDSDSDREGGEGGNGDDDDDDDDDDNGRNDGDGGAGNAAYQEQQEAVNAALAATIKYQQERKRKGKAVATGEPSKNPRVSEGAGVIIGVPPPRQLTPQRSAVPLTTSTPMLTLTTTLVTHERLGLIPQMALTEIPRPPAILSTISSTAPMRPPSSRTTTQPPPPPPSDVSFMRISRPQGPVQPVHPSLYNLPPGRQTEMLMNLLHLYEKQMAADRQNQERLMEHQRRLMGYVSFCQKETKSLRVIFESQGVKLK
ncbi:uncharacterized protein LOC143573455 [Bidens hawaiensis]|uniref:uncharacterized protein LOC143573455 n=1 Tax=Bidens hawaiensis TaxID=980011 RepID=UPI0040497A58